MDSNGFSELHILSGIFACHTGSVARMPESFCSFDILDGCELRVLWMVGLSIYCAIVGFLHGGLRRREAGPRK